MARSAFRFQQRAVRASLADAETTEDHAQQIVRRKLPGDQVQLFLRQTKFLGEQVELTVPFARMRISQRKMLPGCTQGMQVPFARNELTLARTLPASQLQQ